MKEYVLLHQNKIVALLFFSDSFERIEKVKVNPSNLKAGPCLGNVSLETMTIWWNHRAIPLSRNDLYGILEENHCVNPSELLASNLALSLTDSYWIRPLDCDDLRWENVNLFHHMDGKNLVLMGKGKSFLRSDSSLNGQMKKYWERNQINSHEIENLLIKKSETAYGQQNINEAFASLVHLRQGLQPNIDFVDYQVLLTEGKGLASRCAAFTSARKELIYAAEFTFAEKKKNEESLFDHILHVAGHNGLDEQKIRAKMEYMLSTDFILSNQDRHLFNFGFLRDPDTMQLIGFAPLYDSGNSMLWDKSGVKGRFSLLDEEISGLSNKSIGLLKYISDRSLVDIEKLPSERETEDFYYSYGVPKERSKDIAQNYIRKVDLFNEFQQGRNLNLYEEKKQKRNLSLSQTQSFGM